MGHTKVYKVRCQDGGKEEYEDLVERADCPGTSVFSYDTQTFKCYTHSVDHVVCVADERTVGGHLAEQENKIDFEDKNRIKLNRNYRSKVIT